MVIFAKTNGHYYNMEEIQWFEKVGDTEIRFHYSNGNTKTEVYKDSKTRDDVYSNIESEFVKECDSSN